LSQKNFVHHKSQKEGSDIKPILLPGSYRLNYSKMNVLSGLQKMLRTNLNKLFAGGVNIDYMGFRGNVSKFRTSKRQK
jgi:hypothetical protein